MATTKRTTLHVSCNVSGRVRVDVTGSRQYNGAISAAAAGGRGKATGELCVGCPVLHNICDALRFELGLDDVRSNRHDSADGLVSGHVMYAPESIHDEIKNARRLRADVVVAGVVGDNLKKLPDELMNELINERAGVGVSLTGRLSDSCPFVATA